MREGIFMDEMTEVRRIFVNKNSYLDYEFGSYGKLYHHTNENLNAYIPNTFNKRVLTVSSSGDHLLNILSNGSFRVDTFDINRFSPLYQSMKLYSIRNLPSNDAYIFLNTLSSELYFKFNKFLPKREKEFFNFVYSHDMDEIAYKLFYLQNINNIVNNKYFDLDVLEYLKNNLRRLVGNHFCTNIYGLSDFIIDKYDYIFLSNISEYIKNVDDFLHFLIYLKLCLNNNGAIYYAYLYEKEATSVIDGIKSINKNFEQKFDPKRYYDIIDSTEIMSFKSAEFPETSKDSVLILRK